MPHFVRYFVAQTATPDLVAIEQGLLQADPGFRIAPQPQQPDRGELWLDTELYGSIHLDRPGSEGFDDEVDEFRILAQDAGGEDREMLLELLDATRVIVAVELLQRGRKLDSALRRLEPLWTWLESKYRGLLQED